MSFLPAAAADAPNLTAEEQLTIRGALTDVEAILQLERTGLECPLAPDQFVDLERGAASISPDARPTLVTEDGWTRPFKVWCDETSWMLVSFGADGRAGAPYPEVDDLSGVGDDVIFLDGRFVAGPEAISAFVDLELQDQTVKNLRSIAITFEAFAIDNDVYPGEPLDAVQGVSKVQPLLQPIYIREFPFVDGWGNPFRFWTDGQNYRIFSSGRDGEAEADYTSVPGTGEFDPYDFDRDIVFGNGEYEQWPAQPGGNGSGS